MSAFEYTFQFTITHQNAVVYSRFFIFQTLLYCDGNGNFYMLKCCSYVKQQSRRKRLPGRKPKQNFCSPQSMKRKETIISNPANSTSSVQVHPFTPDFSVLSLSKPKRKRRKKDAFAVRFSDISSTPCSASSKKRTRARKKKKSKVGSRTRKIVLMKCLSYCKHSVQSKICGLLY